MDVIFTLDESTTIIDHPRHPWPLITDFTGDLVKQLNISPDGSHAGLIIFADVGRIQLSLTDSESDFLTKLGNLPVRGGTTNTTDALYKSRLLLTDPKYSPRAGVPRLVVLVTDGNPNKEEMERVFVEAQACRDAGVRVVVVGVGSVNDEIASKLSYQTDDYVHVERFDQLKQVKDLIITAEVCEIITTTTTPAPTTTTPEPTTITPEPTTTTPEPTTTTPEPTTTTPEPTTTTTPYPTSTTPEPTTTAPEPTTTTTPYPTTTTTEPPTTTPDTELSTKTPAQTTTKPPEPPTPAPVPPEPECEDPQLVIF
jgi:uncharacterized protein YegL